MTTLNNFHVIAYINEISHIIGEIFVDDASELPTPNGITGYELVQGSVAYVVHSGELYVMSGDGEWYNSEDGTPAETENENESSQE